MGWQVALTDEADADLERVVAFLAQKSPTAAERIGLELVALVFALEKMPNRGTPVRKRPAQAGTSALSRDLSSQGSGFPGGNRAYLGQPTGSGQTAVALD